MPQPLTIWCNAHLPPAELEHLRRSAEPHRLVLSGGGATSNLHAGGPDAALATADVALGQPDPRQVIESPGVKWVHLTSAGYTRYDSEPFRAAMKARGGVLTNSSSVYDAPCAEHALAMMLALARQLPQCLDDQRGERRWLGDGVRRDAYLLDGQRLLIYGYGAIGRRLAEMLIPLRMEVTGVRRRSTGGAEPVPVVTPAAAEELLPSADHVMNILPLSDHTAKFFDAGRLAKLSPTARFYNIGRGGTVDQAALTTALSTGKIAGAYLDVTDPEPSVSPGVSIAATPTSVVPGQTVTYTLQLTDTGNVDATGPLTANVGLTVDGATAAVPVASATRSVRIPSSGKPVVLACGPSCRSRQPPAATSCSLPRPGRRRTAPPPTPPRARGPRRSRWVPPKLTVCLIDAHGTWPDRYRHRPTLTVALVARVRPCCGSRCRLA